MPDHPPISVVTAAFNASAFLPDCLKSVRSQTCGPNGITHVVIDGGSNDGTLEILENAPGVRWISESDRGQADAFNKGVRLADGEWICWLNADDMLAPGAVEAFSRTLAKHPRADVIYGHVQFVTEDSQPAWTSYHLPFFFPLVRSGCYVPPSSGTFFRRELLLREPLDPDYHFVMDVEWFLRCGGKLQAVLVDQTLSRFRISADAKTSEMIRSGKITSRHAEERENYRRRHIYSQWPHLHEDAARNRFERQRKWYLWLYKALKMRYALRYLQQRRMP